MERMVSFGVTLSLHVALGWALISAMASGTARPGAAQQAAGTPLVVELIPLERPGAATPSAPQAGQQPRHRLSPAVVADVPGRHGDLAAADPAPLTHAAPGAPPATASSTPAMTDLPSAEAQAWRDSVQTHLARYRLYPSAAASTGRQGMVLLHFTVKRNGQVEQAWIDTSSGVAEIDRETIAAILRAQPLPSFPAGWPDTLDIRLPVSFRLG
ncbi:TonB family protein [Sphingomonas sp. PB4P5]|uniref:TonB family protein n=1 Tax=Parasphingomonas puruogangriensis TaxID=3096155 RepID=UPI002FCC53D0